MCVCGGGGDSTQIQSSATTRSRRGRRLLVNLLSVNICFASIQTCKISNPRGDKPRTKNKTEQNEKKLKKQNAHPLTVAHQHTHSHACTRTHTHTHTHTHARGEAVRAQAGVCCYPTECLSTSPSPPPYQRSNRPTFGPHPPNPPPILRKPVGFPGANEMPARQMDLREPQSDPTLGSK